MDAHPFCHDILLFCLQQILPVSSPSICPFSESDSKNHAGHLRIRVKDQLGKQRQGISGSKMNLLGSLYTQQRYGKSFRTVVIEIRRPGHCSGFRLPFQSSQSERGSQGKERRIRPVAFQVYPVISGKVRIPVHIQKTEIISYLRLKRMAGIRRAEMKEPTGTVEPIIRVSSFLVGICI